jgi:hypothetical protein
MRARKSWPRTPSPATAMSAIALFVSLGGIGYAAIGAITSPQIQNNTIQSKDIKDETLQNKDIAEDEIEADRIEDAAIRSQEIKNNTIALKDIAASAEEELQGQQGPMGPVGPAGTPGDAGPAGRSALTTLQSGERIYGVAGVQGQGPNLWTGVTFQIPAPTPVDSLHVVIANNDTITGDGCTGTAADPVSAPGYVCLYSHLAVNTTSGYGWGARCSCGDATATGDGSRFGFMVQANGQAGALLTANWIWVYTAP